VASQKARGVENPAVFRAKARDFSTCTGHLFDVAENSIVTFSEEATMSTATATMVRKANIRETTLEVLFTEHAIPNFYWEEMKALVYYGQRPAADLLFRLNHVGNYMQCLRAILGELSKQCKHRFPPKGWQPSARRKAG